MFEQFGKQYAKKSNEDKSLIKMGFAVWFVVLFGIFSMLCLIGLSLIKFIMS